MKIILKPLGEISGRKKVLNNLAQSLSSILGCAVDISSEMEISDDIYNTDRGQYNAASILKLLETVEFPAGSKMLGITDVDIFVPELNYVFGLADINGAAAIISIARLRQEFYGLPADEHLFLERTVKEAVHELGHVFGLQHCNNINCVMHFSNSLHDTDIKQTVFCQSCKPGLII